MNNVQYQNIHQFNILYYTYSHSYQDSTYFSQELHSSNSLHSHRNSSRFHFCFQLHTLPINSHLHEHKQRSTINLVSFIPEIKLNAFIFIFFTFFETQTRAYGSLIVLQPINNNSKWIKKSFIRVYIRKYWSNLTC